MESMRQLAGIRLGHDPIPDETTILNFRRLLEEHNLTEALFPAVKSDLSDRGDSLKPGTMVEAPMMAAPSSTKNQERKRDGDRSSTKKNDPWYFGLKAHIGVEADSGLVPSVEATRQGP